MTTPIVALDVPTAAAARELVAQLGEECRFYKIGSELFTAAGPEIVHMVRNAGCEVFLDLKLHDIPNTVRAAARAASAIGASLLTVHATGGLDMIEAAVDGAREDMRVLGVTILTSHTAESVAKAWGRSDVDVMEEVLRLSRLTGDAGGFGVVCSGREAAAVRARQGPSFGLLVPGVRLEGGAAHDQARVVTPADAASAGADYIVLGRAVTAAPHPLQAMREVHRLLGCAD